jgi:hypothetical protein
MLKLTNHTVATAAAAVDGMVLAVPYVGTGCIQVTLQPSEKGKKWNGTQNELFSRTFH